MVNDLTKIMTELQPEPSHLNNRIGHLFLVDRGKCLGLPLSDCFGILQFSSKLHVIVVFRQTIKYLYSTIIYPNNFCVFALLASYWKLQKMCLSDLTL